MTAPDMICRWMNLNGWLQQSNNGLISAQIITACLRHIPDIFIDYYRGIFILLTAMMTIDAEKILRETYPELKTGKNSKLMLKVLKKLLHEKDSLSIPITR